MGNCLKTQLKESVNNGNIPYFNTTRFFKYLKQNTFNTNLYVKVAATTNNVLSARLSDGSTFLKSDGTPLANIVPITNAGTYIWLPLDECIMLLEGKENIKSIETSIVSNVSQNSAILLPDLAYCTNIEKIDAVVVGNVNELSSCVNLQYFKEKPGSNIGGDFATGFGNCSQINYILIGPNNTEGSIEEFVAAQRLAGRTSVESTHPITVNITRTKITFNGGLAATATDTPLYWDASTITYNGVTINA